MMPIIKKRKEISSSSGVVIKTSTFLVSEKIENSAKEIMRTKVHTRWFLKRYAINLEITIIPIISPIPKGIKTSMLEIENGRASDEIIVS